MAGSSAAEDGGIIITAARNKHTRNPTNLFIVILIFRNLENTLNVAVIIRILRVPGLPQSEIACYEKHHYNNTNDVKNIVHVKFTSLSRDRIIFNLQIDLG